MNPIKPDNRDKYPADWKEISRRIRMVRAEGRCECEGECGYHEKRCELEHGTIVAGVRLDEFGIPNYYEVCLTVAHLDHDPTNCSESNLKAMCQSCHLRYDATRKKADRLRRKNEGQLTLEFS